MDLNGRSQDVITLHNKLFTECKVWYDSYQKIVNNPDKDETDPKYEDYSAKRLFKEGIRLINFEMYQVGIDELNEIIDNHDFFINNIYTNEYMRKIYIRNKSKKDYLKKVGKDKALTRKEVGELTKKRQLKKGLISKALVYNIVCNLKASGEKVTSGTIFKVMQGLDGGLGLTQCKKYLKELRNEDKI
jgi:hypothetical protein